MIFWDTVKFFDNIEIDKFRQFLYCLNNNRKNRVFSEIMLMVS
jgi:hypothetical protein